MSSVLMVFVVLGVLYLMIQSILKPQWALLLVLSFFPLEQLLSSYVPMLARTSWITNVSVGLIAMAAFGLEFLRGKRPLDGYFNPIWVLVGLLYVFTVFGVLWSPIPEAGRYFIQKGFPYYILLLIILPGLIRDIENIKKFFTPFMAVGSLIIFFILTSPHTQIYGGRLLVDLSRSTGASDDLQSPLVTAELGGAVLIVAALYKPTRYIKAILLLRVITIFAGIGVMLLSGTRGQLIFAIGLSVAVFPIAHQVKNTAQFLVTSAAAGAMGLLFLLAIKIFLSGSSDSGVRWSADNIADGISSRMYYATTILEEYLSRPSALLGGLGTGAFNAYASNEGDNYIYPHNLIVEILTEHGLIGIGLLAGIFGLMAAASLRLYRNYKDDIEYRSTFAILLALCAYATLISMKQGTYTAIPTPFFWYLVLAKIDNQTKARNAMQYIDYTEYESAEYSDYSDTDLE
ncbi:MAG: O-antigen ligase family protein [Phycisphaerales bacterium]|nr:O-antigen ligase family protein [Phycisphaerales bacterium]